MRWWPALCAGDLHSLLWDPAGRGADVHLHEIKACLPGGLSLLQGTQQVSAFFYGYVLSPNDLNSNS